MPELIIQDNVFIIIYFKSIPNFEYSKNKHKNKERIVLGTT